MLLKWIQVTAHPGRFDDLLARQRIWNKAMERQRGFRRIRLATDPTLPDDLFVLVEIRCRKDLDRFMNEVHDELEERTGIRETYSRCATRVLELSEL